MDSFIAAPDVGWRVRDIGRRAPPIRPRRRKIACRAARGAHTLCGQGEKEKPGAACAGAAFGISRFASPPPRRPAEPAPDAGSRPSAALRRPPQAPTGPAMPALPHAALLFAVVASFFFGFSVLTSKQGLRYVDAQTGSMISIATTVTIYTLIAPFFVKWEYWTSPGIWLFLGNGLIHPMISMAMSFEATRRMGATVSSTVSSTSPWFATIGAVLLLGEALTLSNLLGTLATVAGIMVLTYDPGRKRAWKRTDLLFALAAAVVRGSNNLIGKFGLDLLPVPFMAAWLSFSVSLTGAVIVYRVRNGRLPLRLPRQGLRWFSYTGTCISAAILCMYTALSLGSVVVVSPVVAAFPIWTLLFSLLLRQEIFNPKLVLGVLVVVSGVVLIALR
jgi:drug/metabolite transporter (DMT)-like permease